ncbi:recombinase family protein [Streptomyces sp. NPDC002104]
MAASPTRTPRRNARVSVKEPVRILGALRESKLREWSDSFEGQEDDVIRLVDYKEAHLVHVTHDRDVSGREVRLFQRPDLGPWLKQANQFDGIAAQKMDRITRRPSDLYLFLEWLKDHGKFLITHKDGIDTRTDAGKRYAELMGMVGSWEWEAIQERNSDSVSRARAEGRYHGGDVPYGYRIVGAKGDWRYAIDEEQQKVIFWMIERFLEGWTYMGIAEDLDRRKVPTSKGRGQWSWQTVRRILASRRLLGEDSKGNIRCEGVVPVPVWQAVQKEAERRKAPVREKPRQGAAPLLGVAYCALCTKRLHKIRERTQCHTINCPMKSIATAELWEFIEAWMTLMSSGVERHEHVVIPGLDNRPEIRDVKTRVARLRRQDEDGDWDDDRAAYKRRMADLRARLKDLEKEPVVPDRDVWKPTGESYRDFWKRCTELDKGEELRRIGAKLYVDAGMPRGTLADGGPAATGRLRFETPSQWDRWRVLGKPRKAA